MSVNKVILVGNVGKDPEVRHLDSGVAVANFPLATSESYTAKNGERVTTTEWHNIVLWRGLADVAEKYVTKGRQLYIEGRIRTRSYDDKDGNKRYITEIYGDSMQMLGTKADNQGGGTQSSQASQQASTPTFNEPEIEEPAGDDDLPF
ncbi:single-stranded DNA-binding protein [Prolixibacteraceae bacterium Z1-6]|uniref:Single-stranded DNA-binding protein n=1 Tax=Draconibacterium aestuarii TaxID=2998507 RepID=A0A9X3F8H7_9BACT|nr:single-stranded DNA-binding protein [Prolixibacteraceae bacterium Z1-6]